MIMMMRRLVAAAAIAAAISGPAVASTILYRTDAELVALSERVVHGRVLSQRTERPLADGPIFTVTTLAVLEDLTGVAGDTVDVWGGGVRQRRHVRRRRRGARRRARRSRVPRSADPVGCAASRWILEVRHRPGRRPGRRPAGEKHGIAADGRRCGVGTGAQPHRVPRARGTGPWRRAISNPSAELMVPDTRPRFTTLELQPAMVRGRLEHARRLPRTRPRPTRF